MDCSLTFLNLGSSSEHAITAPSYMPYSSIKQPNNGSTTDERMLSVLTDKCAIVQKHVNMTGQRSRCVQRSRVKVTVCEMVVAAVLPCWSSDFYTDRAHVISLRETSLNHMLVAIVAMRTISFC